MNFDKQELLKIADLSKLSIEDDKAVQLTQDLSNILALVAKMDNLNTESVEPLAHPLDQVQPLRQDQVTEANQRELLQELAPKTYAGLYIVPKVIDQE
ncbi:MAG: Asp-tRNA(Asn)/Glu-tRNA(Gln) amidotransferase subunit GatC [Gammaproteobacteria bacterium]|nr:Asp-tRNA(Asn)/Glu-tRNA(Gln) amidotransferase subunit GatC [Gammaproteobacteria bacterium]